MLCGPGDKIQTAVERREAKSKGERERYTQLDGKFQRRAETEKAFFKKQCKEIEENNKRGRLEISSRKLEISKEHFNPNMGTIKDRNGKDLREAEKL